MPSPARSPARAGTAAPGSVGSPGGITGRGQLWQRRSQGAAPAGAQRIPERVPESVPERIPERIPERTHGAAPAALRHRPTPAEREKKLLVILQRGFSSAGLRMSEGITLSVQKNPRWNQVQPEEQGELHPTW